MNDAPLPRLSYSLLDAAEMLGISEKLLRRACQQHLIKSTRMGNRLTIPAAEVERIALEGIPSPEPDKAKPQAPGSRPGRPAKGA